MTWPVETPNAVAFAALQVALGLDISAPYLGLVASRCYVPEGRVASGGSPTMARMTHFARSRIRAPALVYANWYNAIASEPGSGNDWTIKASIEYPAGTFTPVTFGGQSTGTVVDGATITSDTVALEIPYGARFWTRTYIVAASGAIVYNVDASYPGDGMEVGGGATDKTASGTVTQATTSVYGPSAIIDQTTRPSVAIIGDSRTRLRAGAGYSYNGEAGEIAPSLGKTLAVLNLGCPGESAAAFIIAHTKRVALAALCSAVHGEYGINDLIAGNSAATLQANMATIKGYFTQPFTHSTIAPVTTSTDSWATTANQTTAAYNSIRVAVNTWLRAGSLGVPIFDVAAVVESSFNSGLWSPNYTYDGSHEAALGIYAIANSPVLSPAYFQR